MTTQSPLNSPAAGRVPRRWILSLVPAYGLLLATVGAQPIAAADGPASTGTVLFVCEHGSAKSLLAATLFNREAARRHLGFRAIARGTTPDGAPQPATRDGLRSDGVDIAAFVPQRVTTADIESAIAIVVFEVDLSSLNPALRPVARWDNVPPVSTNYSRARDAILQSVDDLIQQLQSAETR